MTAPPTTVRARLGRFFGSQFDPEAVGLRELPFTFVFVMVLVLELAQEPVEHPDAAVLSVSITVVVQLVAVLGDWDRWPRRWQYALPLAQIVAVGAFSYGFGHNTSFFSSMLFLPVVNLALHPGYLGVALGTIGSGVVTLIPVVVPARTVGAPTPEVRALVVTVCAFLVGAGTSAVTRRLRDQTAALERLSGRVEQSRDLLASVIDAATEQLVLATDEHGRIVVHSPGTRTLLGCSGATVDGTLVTSFVDAEELRRAAAARGPASGPDDLLRAFVGEAASGLPDRHEWTLVRPDGTTMPADVTVTRRSRLEDDASSGYLVVATDLTQQREAERLQDEFVGLVSHELRTPLASIMGYVELLRSDEGALTPEQTRSLDVVERNGRRLLRLVEDLLLSVQVAAGTFTLDARPLDAAETVRRSVANLAPTAAAAGVTVSVEAAEPVPLVSDAERLGQVVENLTANAVKFSSRGGSVRVSVRPTATGERRGAALVVADDGVGMTDDELARVTQRFFRSRTAQRQRVRGLGLGLSIVDAIVTAHGGTLRMRSAPGEGTTVTVELPDVEPPGDVSPRPGETPQETSR
ncbi:ATP-binding protein [Mumia sp. DW29H23]|uniref:PAS domain-containing sensor histidine kinase n=1 Tax=Mumia sp. DW29H23 TaxID=3421241 RepID=UPI003D684E8D